MLVWSQLLIFTGTKLTLWVYSYIFEYQSRPLTSFLHPPRVHLMSHTWWMRPGLPCFSRSSTSVYYTERKLKNKIQGRPGNEAIFHVHTETHNEQHQTLPSCDTESDPRWGWLGRDSLCSPILRTEVTWLTQDNMRVPAHQTRTYLGGVQAMEAFTLFTNSEVWHMCCALHNAL